MEYTRIPSRRYQSVCQVDINGAVFLSVNNVVRAVWVKEAAGIIRKMIHNELRAKSPQ